MPIYEYKCQECGARHEVLQKISDDPLVECPSCHAHALQKLVSAAGFRLSGSGWYETDFKSSNKKNLAQSDSKSEAKPKSKESGKAKSSESKSGTTSSSSTSSTSS